MSNEGTTKGTLKKMQHARDGLVTDEMAKQRSKAELEDPAEAARRAFMALPFEEQVETMAKAWAAKIIAANAEGDRRTKLEAAVDARVQELLAEAGQKPPEPPPAGMQFESAVAAHLQRLEEMDLQARAERAAVDAFKAAHSGREPAETWRQAPVG